MNRRSPAARAQFFWMLALFLTALLLRIQVLNWGLPYVEHIDEPNYVGVVTRMVVNGDPNPNFFRHPALVFYLMALVTRVHAWWGMQTGLYKALSDLPTETFFFTTASGVYVWNRALIAVLGAATIAVTYELARRMFGLRVALLAGLLLALSSFHVVHSYYIATSGPTGLWATLALIGAWQVATDGSRRGYLLAALGTGLAAATKYNAGIVGLALAIGALLYCLGREPETTDEGQRPAERGLAALGRVHLPRLLAAGTLAVLIFLAFNPFVLLDWGHFYNDITSQSKIYSGGGGDFEGPWNVAGYARFFWREGLMAGGCIIALAGLPLLLRRAPRQTILLLAAFAVEMLLLLSYEVNFVRNLLIVFPITVIVAAAGAVALADAARTWIRKFRPHPHEEGRPFSVFATLTVVPLAVLAAALLVPQAQDTAWTLTYWSKPHTLVAAAALLRAQPQGMLSAVEMNPVQWAGNPVVEPVQRLADHPLDWYRARGHRYLVVNSDSYGFDERAAHDRLIEGATVLARYPERREGLQPGPGAAVLDLGEHLNLMSFARRAVSFSNVVALQGYAIKPGELRPRITPLEGASVRELRAGQSLQINLYWRALAVTDRDYTLFIHVFNAGGDKVAQRDLRLRDSDYPTSRWQPGELVIDRADLPLPALPPGDYRLEFGLYDSSTGTVLPAQGDLQGPGPNPVLTVIRVVE